MPRCQLAVCVLVLLLAVGCANPADSVPKAETGEAEPVDAAGAGTDAGAEAGEDGAAAATETLPIDAETTTVGFVGSKVTGSHEGGFKKVTGNFHLVPGEPEASRLEAEIDMDSTWSDNEKLTGHLKNADFFDVEKYPTAKFVSTKIEKTAGGQGAGGQGAGGQADGATHTVTGNLTLHGVTKSISFPATLAVTDGAAKLSSEFSINRKDFGINYSGQTDNLIRDEVVIKLAVDAPRAAAADAGAAK